MDTVRFSKIVDEILEGLPQNFKDHFNNLAFIVQDYPEKEIQQKYCGRLLGLFRGIPKTHQSIWSNCLPQEIFLYKKNIESVCTNEAEIIQQIEITLKHEIGHYFGLNEKDLQLKGY